MLKLPQIAENLCNNASAPTQNVGGEHRTPREYLILLVQSASGLLQPQWAGYLVDTIIEELRPGEADILLRFEIATKRQRFCIILTKPMTAWCFSHKLPSVLGPLKATTTAVPVMHISYR